MIGRATLQSKINSVFIGFRSPTNALKFTVYVVKYFILGSSGIRRKRITITGDGHCLFRAISYCRTESEGDHAKIRSALVNYVAEGWSFYGSGAMTDHDVATVGAYLTKMSTGWGGDVEISAATRVYWIDFRIYYNNTGYFTKEDPGNTKFCALYFNGKHYDVVEDWAA